MSVRVVAELSCDRCGGNGTIADPGNLYWGTTNGHCKCPNCGGTGAVAREVSCAECGWWFSEHGYLGECRNVEEFMRHFDTAKHHACKAWEPRE